MKRMEIKRAAGVDIDKYGIVRKHRVFYGRSKNGEDIRISLAPIIRMWHVVACGDRFRVVGNYTTLKAAVVAGTNG